MSTYSSRALQCLAELISKNNRSQSYGGAVELHERQESIVHSQKHKHYQESVRQQL
jgi:hypothetical protein